MSVSRFLFIIQYNVVKPILLMMKMHRVLSDCKKPITTLLVGKIQQDDAEMVSNRSSLKNVLLEMMAPTEKRCKNNGIRRIVGVKREDKRRKDELRVEVGVKESFKNKLMRNRLKWAGHVERMGDEKLANL